MAARSLNKVMLIGNLTRDPELRYTPSGTPVCSFGLATNREWTDSSGSRQEDADFHNIVAWNKLGEICANLLFKGRKVYVEGRISNRKWEGQDGAERRTTEIVIDEMIVFGKGKDGQGFDDGDDDDSGSDDSGIDTSDLMEETATEDKPAAKKENDADEGVDIDDIPF